MAIKKLSITDFQAGIGTLGQKRDKPGSARFLKNLDPYEDQSYVTLSRKTTKISSTTITALPKWMVDASPYSTDRYIVDASGNIYKLTSGGTLTQDRAGSTITDPAVNDEAFGQGLAVFNDYLYYPTERSIGRKGRLSATPSYDDDAFSDSDWPITQDLLDNEDASTGNTYSVPTSINEGATHRQTFTTDMDPIGYITLYIAAKGTGNWTITIHDSFDIAVGSKTIANASLGAGGNTFLFDPQVRVKIGNEYHFHVTSTVADGTVTSGSSNDLETGKYKQWAGILIEDSDYHPMISFEDLLVIGNKNYLATFNEAEYDPNTIAFEPGFNIRTLFKNEEYIVAECYKGDSIVEAESYKRYYWDGIAPSFNFSEPIAGGAPNAATFLKGEHSVGVYGFRGTLFDSKSGRELTHEIPKLAKGKNIEVFPGAIDTYEKRILVGYAGSTDDTSGVELGVYEYGGQVEETEKGLNLPFVISTGNTQATNLKIGLVKVIGKDIYIGWRDDS